MKNKTKIILISILSALIVVVLALSYFLIDISLIGDKEITLNYNEEYFENGYSASFVNRKLEVEVENNINNKAFGEYYVKYTASSGLFKKSVKRIVRVLDNEKPRIELDGGSYICLTINETYKEKGYTAIDNYDGNITDRVIVNGEINNQVAGQYELVYSVEDSYHNIAQVSRIVEVLDQNIITDDPKDFWLKGHYEDVLLSYQEIEYDYFKDTVFLGDSNTVYLYQRGEYIPKNQIWGRNNLNIVQIQNSEFTCFADGKNYNLEEALDTYKPKYLVVTPGISSALFIETSDYKTSVESFISSMVQNHPETKLIMSSIWPVNYGAIKLEHQLTINEYNYYMLEICHKYDVPFINFSDEIRGEDGYGLKDYLFYDENDFYDTGFHLNDLGKTKFVEYFKHLDLERTSR